MAGIHISQPSPTASQRSGPTLFGLLASKRLAKQFASRVYARRTAPSSSTSRYDTASYAEPTYRMEPRIRFDVKQVRDCIEDIVSARMKGFQYSPSLAGKMTKLLTEDIKERVKEFNFERYKIVCVVSVGQTKGQGLRVTSRCTWDISTDNHCTYTWTNSQVFCTATVFGLYHD